MINVTDYVFGDRAHHNPYYSIKEIESNDRFYFLGSYYADGPRYPYHLDIYFHKGQLLPDGIYVYHSNNYNSGYFFYTITTKEGQPKIASIAREWLKTYLHNIKSKESIESIEELEARLGVLLPRD